MEQKQRMIKATHAKHGGTQLFPESHWRLVDKRVWIEIPSEAKQVAPPLPEVEADLEQRAKEVHEQPKPKGRPKSK